MNLDYYLHTHIEARYSWEPDEYKCRPSYFYPKEQRYSKEFDYSENKYGEMKKRLTEHIKMLMQQNGY